LGQEVKSGAWFDVPRLLSRPAKYVVKYGQQQVGTRNFVYGAVTPAEVLPDR